MKKILRSRLPDRLAGRVPALLVEIAVAAAITGTLTLARLALVPLAADRAPYALVFVAVIAAGVLAGWRSGLMALVLGQLLSWYLVVDPANYARAPGEYIGGLAVATFAQLIILAIVHLYQREVDRAWARREEQVDLMEQALAEIDHRTSNNYQTVLALVLAQAKRADPDVRQALMQVADRIEAIATVSKQMAHSSDSLEEVRLTEYLGELCRQINRGLTRPGVSLECHSDELSVDASKAIAISIIINELVTNALKHAFPDDRHGRIEVSLRRGAGQLELEVVDDGVGMNQAASSRGSGLGSRLIDTFVKRLGADYRTSSGEQGTRHRIAIPLNG